MGGNDATDLLKPVSFVAMTHNLCVEFESAFVSLWVHVRWGVGGLGVCVLMQCFPTLPLPPLPFPSSSSLLCTVDDSDPGQSSETWGERLVAPCRIYAGNHDRPTPSLMSSTSHITHSAPLCCYEHTSTSVFSPCICPVAAHACLCLAKSDYWSLGDWRSAVYTWLAYENVVFLVPSIKTSHLLSVSSYADTRGGKMFTMYGVINLNETVL